MKKIDMIGKRFGHLVVEKEHSTTRNGHIRYVCVCDCGNYSNVLGTHLRQNNTKSCGCIVKFRRGSRHNQWDGEGEISGAFWYDHVVRGATGQKGRKKLELSIDKKYAWDLFIEQNKKCALSGIELKFPEKSSDIFWTASLDRIDSSLGYIKGNVQWVHKDVNLMKNKLSQDYFIEVCKKITLKSSGGEYEKV